jgi:hypothetical protein
VVTKKAIPRTGASPKSLPSKRDARLAAVRHALTKYFLGSAITGDKFWSTNNPSLGNKSPANMVKAGKLKTVEQYVSYLVEHTRSVRPKSIDNPRDNSFTILDGTKDEVLEKMKEIPANHGVIAISFQNAEAYYTYAPVVRGIVNQLPKIVGRLLRRNELLCARLLFAFTADLPVTFPKLSAPTKLYSGKRTGKVGGMAGMTPDSPEIPRRRVNRK